MIEEKLLTESFFSQRTSKIKRFVEVHRFARFLNKIVPKEKKIVLVGIGDPEVHADYVGPNSIALIQYFMDSVPMYGNILFPVKGGNTNEYAKKLREKYPDSVIIGIDATIGKAETGTIIISNRPVNPGSGMNLHYDPMGDVSILGIIGESQGLVRAKKNDEAIDRMTEFIAEAIICWVTNYRHQALTDGNFFEKAPFAPTARKDK